MLIPLASTASSVMYIVPPLSMSGLKETSAAAAGNSQLVDQRLRPASSHHVDEDLAAADETNKPELVNVLLTEMASAVDQLKRTALSLAAAAAGHAEAAQGLGAAAADVADDMKAACSSALLLVAAGPTPAHTEAVRSLSTQATVSTTNSIGRQPLALAAAAGNTASVQVLLDMGANVNASGTDKMTALHLASAEGHSAAVDVLLQRGAALSQANTAGLLPLHVSAEHGHASVLQLLLHSSSTTTGTNTGVDVLTAGGATALHLASRNGHAQAVKLLISEPWHADMRKCWGSDTAAHLAGRHGRLGVLEVLLDAGLPANVVGGYGCLSPEFAGVYTPLAAAIVNQQVAAVQLLLARGVLEGSRPDGSALVAAIHASNTQILRMLIAAGADVNFRFADGAGTGNFTVLHAAAASGQHQAVLILLDAGAQIDAVADDGSTPLYVAAHDASIVQVLLSAGSLAVNSADTQGRTPLMMASANGHADVVSKLLAAGAAVDTATAMRPGGVGLLTAHHAAATTGQLSVVTALLAARASVSLQVSKRAQDSGGRTPLHIAAELGRCSVMQALVNAAPAAVDTVSHEGFTALMTAAKRGQAEAVQVLLDAGASVVAVSPGDGTALNIAAVATKLAAVQRLLTHSSSQHLPVADLIRSALAAKRSTTAEPAAQQHTFQAIMSAAMRRDSVAVRQYIKNSPTEDAAALCEFMMDGWMVDAERIEQVDLEKAGVQHLIVGAAGLMSQLGQATAAEGAQEGTSTGAGIGSGTLKRPRPGSAE